MLLSKLPLHVVARGPRRDGTFNVLFRVRKDRPQGWPSSIPIPRERRRGNLNDPGEVARILADAAELTRRLEAERDNKPVGARPGTMPAVAAQWQASWEGDIRPRTQEAYRKSLRPLLAWSGVLGHPPIKRLTLPQILAFLAGYKDRPAQQAALRRCLSALLSFARANGIIETHPLGVPVRVKRARGGRKRPVELWTAEIVQTYAGAADAAGWRGIGNMLWLCWETSADATDVVTWRRGEHFRDAAQPAISYTRGKTGERATVPISHRLAARLRQADIFLVTDPDGRPYKAECVKSDNQRSWHFRKLRSIVTAAGGARRVLDHLRHSAVTDALTKGAKMEHLPSLTAHRGEQMVEAVYSQMTEDQARAVQKARGIIE